MQNNKLVSIITPCYNGEHCLFRLLDSIIAQTYRPIEFILVNDGSTDGSLALAESYAERFKAAGIDYTIVNQENKGLGGAIDAGLKHFSGDYICWPDADDYFEPTSVEERVKVLEENPEYAVVSSDAYMRDSDHLDSCRKLLSSGLKHLNDRNQFEHLINGESVFCPGCHMARAEMFLDVHPDRSIYPARRGQNWQLLLPIYYKYPWIFLNKPLYNYIIYANSMSRGDVNCETKLFRADEHEKIITESLKKIEQVQNADMSYYYDYVRRRYAKIRLKTACKFKDKEAFMKQYKTKKKELGLDFEDRMQYLSMKIPAFSGLARLCGGISQKLNGRR